MKLQGKETLGISDWSKRTVWTNRDIRKERDSVTSCAISSYDVEAQINQLGDGKPCVGREAPAQAGIVLRSRCSRVRLVAITEEASDSPELKVPVARIESGLDDHIGRNLMARVEAVRMRLDTAESTPQWLSTD